MRNNLLATRKPETNPKHKMSLNREKNKKITDQIKMEGKQSFLAGLDLSLATGKRHA